jgi:hypothetical protein
LPESVRQITLNHAILTGAKFITVRFFGVVQARDPSNAAPTTPA